MEATGRMIEQKREWGAVHRQEVGIKGFLEWAFGTERARLSFGGSEVEFAPASFGMEYVLIERQRLGCKVDGGRGVATSLTADDAEMVADAVTQLPEGCGGRRMAILVAECARSGLVPDWMPEARPRVVPREWQKNRHGRHARSEIVGTVTVPGRRGPRPYQMRACPVTYAPSVAQIAEARRVYLLWWMALLHLRCAFQERQWRRHVITDTMPPMAPWKAAAKKSLTKI